MRYWFALIPLPEAAIITLSDAGLKPWPEDGNVFPEADCLLLYDSPDQLLSMAGVGHEAAALTASSLLDYYSRLLGWSEQTGQPLLSISQLQLLGPHLLRALLADGAAVSPASANPLPIPPLLALVTLSLLDAEPGLLDCYLDLELRATLLGRDPDLRYSERLRDAVQEAEDLLQAFLISQRVQAAASELMQEVARRDSELKEAREASELSLFQLHQVQEEREHYRLADDEKRRQLEARNQELEELRVIKSSQENAHQSELQALREWSEQRIAELVLEVASRDTELKETRDASELSLLQLHKLQEEREHYRLADEDNQRQLEARNQELEELRLTKTSQENAYQSELRILRESSEQRLSELVEEVANRDTELKQTREASDLSLFQLHQVQEEREHYRLADDEKRRQLEARNQELEELRVTKTSQENAYQSELRTLRESSEKRLAELVEEVASRDTELMETREASELSSLQLHKLQEEREQYRLADADKQRQLDGRNQELEELRVIKTSQENAHQSELQSLRDRFEGRITEMEREAASSDMEFNETREAAQLTLLQLHQVQEELEKFILAAGELQRQLDVRNQELEELRVINTSQQIAHQSELQALRDRLEGRIAELELRLATSDMELKETREAVQVSLLQLHQVQEELENFILAAGELQRQLDARNQELVELRVFKTSQEGAHQSELQALRDSFDSRIAELELEVATSDVEIKEAREAAQISLLQLHQVQEELENLFLADGETQRQLEARDFELEELRYIQSSQESAHELELNALRVRLERQLAEMDQHLSNRDKELQESREAAEFSMLQLHQVQEELEHCFLNARASDQLAQAQFEQLQRARRLMLRLHPDVLPPSAPFPRSLEVQVLPDFAGRTPNSTLQTEALLHTYAASLQRASALLERAQRS